MNAKEREIRRLSQERQTVPFLRVSLFALLALLVLSWPLGGFQVTELTGENRVHNLRRFFREAIPYPLRDGFSFAELGSWMLDLWQSKGQAGLLATLAIAVLAILFAGIASGLLSPLAARSLMSARPYRFGAAPQRSIPFRLITALTRAVFIFLRSIPEYIWAFIFLTLLGPGSWPAILALAVHNTGVLGRLYGDLIENLDKRPLSALSMLGASRAQLTAGAIVPTIFPRFLLFFFYRWETCVRESTVLGLLGVVSLGYWIQDARSRTFYDEMLFFIFLGAVIVAIGDVVSAVARKVARGR